MAERKPKMSIEEKRARHNACQQAARARKRLEAGLPTKPVTQKTVLKDKKQTHRLPDRVQDLSKMVKIEVKSMNMTVYAKPGTTEAEIIEKYSKRIVKF